jgi:hypothetical protein
MKHKIISKGPTWYEDWRALHVGDKLTSKFDPQFYSDAHIVDDVPSGCGPFSFFLLEHFFSEVN